jgi:hypothetical protein
MCVYVFVQVCVCVCAYVCVCVRLYVRIGRTGGSQGSIARHCCTGSTCCRGVVVS